MGEHWIRTAHGNRFAFDDPAQRTYDIDEIAVALSRLCRFGGHLKPECQHAYSVAQHSVFLSQLVSPEHAFAALLHDAHEAFVGDMPRPLKEFMRAHTDAYDLLEALIATELSAAFGLAWPPPPAVLEADTRLCKAEARYQMTGGDEGMSPGVGAFTDAELAAADVCFEDLVTPTGSTFRFMRRFRALREAPAAARAALPQAFDPEPTPVDTEPRDQRQICKVCGKRDGFCFQIDNAVWKIIVSPEHQNHVVCLACFDEMAFEKGISYDDAVLDELYFAGRGDTGLMFRLHRC